MATAAKAGWIDAKYIKNGMTASKRSHDKGRLIAARSALSNKLRYERYRIGRLDGNDLSPEARHADYKSAYRSTQQWVDHGMGHTVGQILASAEKYGSAHMLARSWLFSPDPAALALLPEADRVGFMDRCIEALVIEHHETLCNAPDVEFSYIIHDKPDSLGRDRLHAHITLPGTVYDQEQGCRVTYPFVDRSEIQDLQMLSQTVVEAELDLRFGREWRLQIPEYEASYYARPELLAIPEDIYDLSAWFPRSNSQQASVTPSPPVEDDKTFSAPSPDVIMENTGVLIEASPVADDSTGQAEVVLSNEPGHDGHDLVGNEPRDLEKTQAPIWFDDLLSDSKNLIWSLSTDRSIAGAVYGRWEDTQQQNVIHGYLAWQDDETGAYKSASQVVYTNCVFDYIWVGGQVIGIEEATRAAHNALDYTMTGYADLLTKDFNSALTELYLDWFSSASLSPAAIQDEFFPELPRTLLPFREDEIKTGVERLPYVEWFSPSPEDDDLEFGFTTQRNGDDSQTYVLKRWTDQNRLQQIDSQLILNSTGSVSDQVQLLELLINRAKDDFSTGIAIAQELWNDNVRENDEPFLAEGPDNPFPTIAPNQVPEIFSEDEIERSEQPISEDEIDEDVSQDEFDWADDE